MTIVKRFSAFITSAVLCFFIVMGSLSFFPTSFAVSPVYFSSEVPSISGFDYIFYVSYSLDGTSFLSLNYFNLEGSSFSPYPRVTFRQSSNRLPSFAVFRSNGLQNSFFNVTFLLDSNNSIIYDSAVSSDVPGEFYFSSTPSDVSFYSSSISFVNNSTFPSDIGSLVFSKFVPPLFSSPLFFDFSPFFFPELPHGYFDGNINVLDGSYNLNFPSSSIDGTVTPNGNSHYSYFLPDIDINGATDLSTGNGSYSFSYLNTGQITQTANPSQTIKLSTSEFDSVVTYKPSYKEDSRFRCWSAVVDSSYLWFVSDTRNKITGSMVSATDSEVNFQYVFKDNDTTNILYPVFAIVFSPFGEVVQTLSPTAGANGNTLSFSCSIGDLTQDDQSGFWSVDPLYHGYWFSQDSPPMQGIGGLKVADNKKVLANPVFGESAFQLNFLDSINSELQDVNSNLKSLQQSFSSDISNQTNAIQNMTAEPAVQPDTKQTMEYFAQSSVFNAPSTDDIFSSDISTGHYWEGVTWWSSKFNDIIISNDVIVAFTTAMLTLGLAVLIIGRRFSMR